MSTESKPPERTVNLAFRGVAGFNERELEALASALWPYIKRRVLRTVRRIVGGPRNG